MLLLKSLIKRSDCTATGSEPSHVVHRLPESVVSGTVSGSYSWRVGNHSH
jgi:hypothetical protein